MKKIIFWIIFTLISVYSWAWSPLDTFETGEQVAAMATYSYEEMLKNNNQMRVNYSGGLTWELRFTGGQTVSSFLKYDSTGKFTKYYVLLPYSDYSFDTLIRSSGKYYDRRLQTFSDNQKIPLGVVYKNNFVEVNCTVVMEMMSLIIRPEYTVKYLQNSSSGQVRGNGAQLFSIEWQNNDNLNMNSIVKNINLLEKSLNSSYTPYYGNYTNGGKYCAYEEKNVRVSFSFNNEGLVNHGQITINYSNQDDARNGINEYISAIKLIGAIENVPLKFNDEYKVNNKEYASATYINPNGDHHFLTIDYIQKTNQFRFIATFKHYNLNF